MPANDKMNHEGRAYYSVAATAKLLGLTKAKVLQLAPQQGMQTVQLNTNGRLWISAKSIIAYEKERLLKKRKP